MCTHLKFFLYSRKLAGIPMTNGVGASNSCKRQHNCLLTYINTHFSSYYSVYALSSLPTVPDRTPFREQTCFCSLHNIYINSLLATTEITCSSILSFKIRCSFYSVILSVLDPRKCEYLKDYSLDFEHAHMTTHLAS